MKLSVVLSFVLLSFSLNAQISFTRNISIPVNENGPLSLGWAGGLNFPLFSQVELNGDNLPDLFVFERSNSRTLTFINNGNSGTDCWEYAPHYADDFPAMRGWAFMYDYNCDNKKDLLTVNFRNNGISLYRNDSSPGSILFTLVDSSIEYTNVGPIPANILASSNLVPDFNDIDGDGDMDIIGQQFQCVGGFAYYKNMSVEHYGTCDSVSDYELSQNIWGGFTLRSGAYKNVAIGSWNVTCFLYKPIFNEENFPYEIARRDDTYASLKTIDMDGDGDKDILIGDSQADNSLLVINGGSPTHAQMISQDTLFPNYDVPVQIHSFSAHAYIDADNDGINDLLVSQSEYLNKEGVYFYKNTGSTSIPQFNYTVNNIFQNQMIDIGESATPVFFDYDSDGLKDLIIGNKLKTTSDSTFVTGLTLYRNTGSLSAPSFDFVTDNYAGLHALQLTGQLYAAFGDLDDDGDIDLILGIDEGSIVYFNNSAGPGVPAVFSSPVFNYMSIDIGQASTPQIIDLNRDGLKDLVMGGKNGLIKYFQNAGSASNPFYFNVATVDTLGGVVVQTIQTPDGYSVPFVFEQDGNYKMLVSCMKGDIYLYGNIDGNLNGTFSIIDTVLTKTAGSRYGYSLSVSGGDINNDTLTDMLIGIYGGGVQIYYQDDLLSGIKPVKDDFFADVFPVPVSDLLGVRLKKSILSAMGDLYDMAGRKILSFKTSSKETYIDVSGISPGIYILRLSGSEAYITRKIIISR